MNIENVCFLIPVHPPHYHYIYSLIDKLKLNNIKIDICLVFSTGKDYDTFYMKNEIQSIVLKSIRPAGISNWHSLTFKIVKSIHKA